MGRYRRGNKHRKRGYNRKRNNGEGDSSSSYSYAPQMTEMDWMLLERYLLDYRSIAYDIHHSKHGGGKKTASPEAADVVIGTHKFLPLTAETCKRPYIDLPDTIGGKERRKIHSLCSHLDIYHAGVGGDNNNIKPNHDDNSGIDDSSENNGSTTPTPKRRIVISIFADGFDIDHILESHHNAKSFPSRTCQPWYYHAHDSKNGDDPNDQYGHRKRAIESEKKQIRQFANLPEKSLRTSDGTDDSFCDVIDFSVVNSLDLSMVPKPEETPWMLVDSVDKLKLCVDELMYGANGSCDNSANSIKVPKIRELAFDLEMCNILDGNNRYESKTGIRTCLIQVTSDVATVVHHEPSGTSTEEFKDFVIDPLAPGVWDAIPTYLGPLFANPSIVKIGQGIGGMDTTSLHRDFGILIVNAFDTYEASTILSRRKSGMGLATMCQNYGLPNWEHYKKLKQKYQCSDWQKRPLDDGALEYGRYDIRFLVTLRKLLMRDLAKMDMLSAGYSRSGSSQEDDSETPGLSTIESQLGSAISSGVSSFSENEFNDTGTSDNSFDNFQDAKEDIDKTLEDNENGSADVFVDSVESNDATTSSTGAIIYASEFPCHHYLMKAISISQKRCLKLWTGDEEELIMRNPSLLSMIKQAANQKGHGKYWTDSNTKLYEKLAEWRRVVAQKEKVHASEVCPLDFLVHVAFKLPKDRWELRRFSYLLPMLLEDENLPYCNQLCELVASSDVFQHKRQLPSPDVVFYLNENGKHNDEERGKGLLKLLLASAVFGAILFTVTRSRRR